VVRRSTVSPNACGEGVWWPLSSLPISDDLGAGSIRISTSKSSTPYRLVEVSARLRRV
jgi:hypothetical protein